MELYKVKAKYSNGSEYTEYGLTKRGVAEAKARVGDVSREGLTVVSIRSFKYIPNYQYDSNTTLTGSL